MELEVVYKSGETETLSVTSFVLSNDVLSWVNAPFSYGPPEVTKGRVHLAHVESISAESTF